MQIRILHRQWRTGIILTIDYCFYSPVVTIILFSRARPRFIDLAPGLSDIVRMSSDHLPDTSTILGKSCLDKTSSGFNYLSDIEEGDDDDDDEDMYWPKQ